MPAALIDSEVIENGSGAPAAGGARHRREPGSWSERAAQLTPRLTVTGTGGRHRRRRKSVLVVAGTPVLLAGAVAVTATTGTLNLTAGAAEGAEGDLALRTGTSESLRSDVATSRAGGQRASRDDDRGLLGGLLDDVLAGEEAAEARSTGSTSVPSAKAGAKTVSKGESKGGSGRDSKEAAKAGQQRKPAKVVPAKVVPAKVVPAFVKPVNRYRLTARFGQSGSRWSRDHTGLDFAAPHGSPVRAVASGTVVSAGWAGAYGLRTVIRHADGTRTWYAHQSRLVVRHGKVKAGQVIGRVGSTGNSTGPHMHLEVRKHGTPVNPATWLRDHGVRV